MKPPPEPVRYPPGYSLTPDGNVAAIRAELDEVTLDLVALSQGAKSWDQVYPDLTNGDRQEEAINLAWERMVRLTRELEEAKDAVRDD